MAATITVACPNCGKKMRASAEHIGKKGRCPACKALVEISAAAGESLATIQAATSSGVSQLARQRMGSTDVNIWLAALLGLAAAAALYLVFLPFGYLSEGTRLRYYLHEVFCERGPIPVITTVFFCWGGALLVLKYLAVKRQLSYAELELELIPLEIGLQITGANVDQFLGHLSNLPRGHRESVLGRRIQGALEHFKSRSSVPEVSDYLNSQGEIDASGVDSGYTLLRVLIWAIPILGFIGTVMGISSAVGELKRSLTPATAIAEPNPATAPPPAGSEAAKGPDLMGALGGVTSGLAVAFDTTFVGLVFAILLMFPTESLRKIEYGMLDRIEEFANESLLRRMADERGGPTSDEMPDVVRAALESAFHEHQRWLAQWQAQVSRLGQEIGASFEGAVVASQEKWSQAESARLETIRTTAAQIEAIFEKAGRTTVSFHQASQQDIDRVQQLVGSLAQIQGALAENARLADQVFRQQKVLLEEYAKGNLGEAIGALQQQVARLAEFIGDARAGAPVEMVPDDRRGLMGWLRGRRH